MRTTERRAALLGLSVLAFACSDGSAPVVWTLNASPLMLSFSETTPAAQLFLTTSPSGGRLEWQVASKPSWLFVEPMNGVINDGVVSVQVSTNGLASSDPGTITGALELISN